MANKEMDGAKSYARRDKLLEIQRNVQTWWDESDVFKAESCEKPPKLGEKFFGNFPYPYMNGLLHIGHAFSLSKLEFAAAYQRLRGANVLLPFGFHCTGMPIKASADKLAREIERFGNPPVFPLKEDQIIKEVPEPEVDTSGKTEPDKFKSKKSKAASKSGEYGLSDAEISKFQDPSHWLIYFPPVAKEDLKAFGLGCDWRRSFITTDMNPYYDSFVSCPIGKLKDMGKIVKDLRYAIYSPLDGQPCADHDRASGEGVLPQDYTLIKMEVVPPFPAKMGVLEGKRVFLAAATLRPETMYGQTNAWVLAEGKYGAYEINETDVFVVTERAALNLAYQNLSRVPEKPTCLVELIGQDLIGLPLRSPLSFNEIIYTLPMMNVLTDKGTGIVTSVPSDSPDDYMTMHDLKTKPGLRAKFGVKDEWILPFEVVPIINIPEFGDKSAEKVCMDLKIKSQNEKEKLAEAKRLTYLKGFTEDAKPLIRSKLLENSQAVSYSEPEKKVMFRSGNECVVALTDQWYITYGEEEWRKMTRNGFDHTLSWLNKWGCSRSFGLGTGIPFDEQFLVESLSDSTLYMAYYTIAHMLQNGEMYGKDTSLMKQEFSYWYPFDLRVSGKDLIQNHLTFTIYNHTALLPQHHWPRGFQCNGHIMLNSEKMSKSTGNFKTLRLAIEDFSADATRFALADAGDGMDDANFVFDTSTSAIMRLTKEISWTEEILESESSLRPGPPSTYADKVFYNEINIAVTETEKNFNEYMFRDALKTGFYDLQAARDEYRFSCGIGGMNCDLLWRFMDVQTRLVTPICPHHAEYVWRKLLKKDTFFIKAGWPEADRPDLTLRRANMYLQDTIATMRKLLEKQISGSKKPNKKASPVTLPSTENKPTIGLIYVNEHYDGWKAECLNILRANFDTEAHQFAPDSQIQSALKQSIQKLCMPFLRFKKDEALSVGIQALDLMLPFGEIEVFRENLELIKRHLGLEQVQVLNALDDDDIYIAGHHANLLHQPPPSPGSPTSIFLS
ncbi:hypothetical protein MKX01_015597 [Papaver californicum]|nr:hypothetical protein MKX01_015597 [Papaver californicum]